MCNIYVALLLLLLKAHLSLINYTLDRYCVRGQSTELAFDMFFLHMLMFTILFCA